MTYTNPRQLVSCCEAGTETGHFSLPASTGKENDEETGYGYFGARYMDHELMTMWLSVDPMADKYPSISPYAYCAWNPVRLVDPNGKEAIDDWYKDAQGHVHWDANVHSQSDLKNGDTYIGETTLMVAEGSDETTYGDQYGNTYSGIPLSAVKISASSLVNTKTNNSNSGQQWSKETLFGVNIGTTMYENAFKSAYQGYIPINEANTAKWFNVGRKVMGFAGKALSGISLGFTLARTLDDGELTWGEGLHIWVQASAMGSAFIPNCGGYISTGFTLVDFIWGEEIEKIGSK